VIQYTELAQRHVRQVESRYFRIQEAGLVKCVCVLSIVRLIHTC
jgi:hypothetical protein